MPRIIIGLLEGAWDPQVVEALSLQNQFKFTDWRSAFGGLSSLDDDYFKGSESESQRVNMWVNTTDKVSKTDGVGLVPGSLVEVPECSQILATSLKPEDSLFYVEASVADVWKRLGLNLPGVPLGLGPVRATWLKLSARRRQAWESIGAMVIDSSHCDTNAQQEAIFSLIHARISAS